MSADGRNARLPLQEWRAWSVLLAVAAVAVPVLAGAVLGARRPADDRSSFVVVAAIALLVELVPLVTAGGRMRGGVSISTGFVVAVLLKWGLDLAVLVRVAGVVIFAIGQRWAWWRAAFNLGQYVVSLGAAALVLMLVQDGMALPPGQLDGIDLVPVSAAVLTFVVVNAVLVALMMAAYQHRPVLDVVRLELGQKLLVNGALLAMAPLIVLTAERSPWLVPLAVVALLAVRGVAAASVRQEQAARHDPLTGLPNRLLFEVRAGEAADSASRGRGVPAVLLLDLDRFKQVNDALGHQAGDELLRQVAARLSGTAGPDSTVARLGGDEFAVLLPELPPDGAVAAAEEMARRLGAALARPFPLHDVPVGVTASIGVAVFPQHGTSTDALLSRADAAMYAAKGGPARYSVSTLQEDRTTPAQLALLGELVRAVAGDPAAGTLTMHYQPLIALAGRTVVGVEALLRWHHPTRGLLLPGQFLPVTGHGALLHQLTGRVLDLALAQRRRWADDGLSLPISVNVTAWDLPDPDFPDWLAGRLAGHGVEASALTLEVAETAIMAETATMLTTLRTLDGLGVAISLDDFGTGYASLTHLRMLPVSEVKIDRSFVGRMCVDADDQIVVRSILELARALGLGVVAEGVEDAATHAALHELGCARAQGNHFSPALPPDRVPAWVGSFTREHQPR